jgi:hypothetical protein
MAFDHVQEMEAIQGRLQMDHSELEQVQEGGSESRI